MSEGRREVLDAAGVAAALSGLASAILEAGSDTLQLAIVGIRRRGVPIAERLARQISEQQDQPIQTGVLDITLYRDDLSLVAAQPVVHGTQVDFPIDGLRVVLTDDVLFTGRTVRSAIEALFALGRPARIELAVLVDRGHRELPIEANYVGQRLDSRRDEIVHVNLSEVDGEDSVAIVTRGGSA